MPYTLRKVRNRSCYRVINKKNKHAFSKCSQKKNAIKQMRLLRAIQFNKKFVPNSTLRRTQKNRK